MSGVQPTAGQGSRMSEIDALYARFYGPLTVLMAVLTLLPYHAPRPDSTRVHGNIWQEVARNAHSIDIASMLVLLVFVVLMTFATLGKLPPGGLVAITVCALLIAIVLWQSPGYHEKPPFTSAGIVDIVMSCAVAALTLTHAVHVLIASHSRSR
ncbi:MAG TPA: hypothetical protein VK053_20290 [Jiangellaceae bacterium]|nr:hypothetical protein [Jiangellaceae bacterium]